MGIKDLLRFMKPYIEPIHIKKYAGKRVGIDAYSWLHKGAYSCSMELCLDSNSEKKLRYIDYFMHRIDLLRHYKIIPVVVFDGGSIPCKANTEHDRHRRRKANRDLAMVKLKEGNVSAASDLFQRAISVTPAMAHQLIQALKSEKIEFVVAPYEADAQLAYLASLEDRKGGISAVITEDSDLLAYGCQATIFKMDRYGNGEEICIGNVFNSVVRKPSFQTFDQELFLGMCVLAGCDFLPSVPGIGIVKAYSLVSKYRNLDRVLSVLKSEKGSKMPEDYSNSFREAVAVFQHARIYDATTKNLKHMKPLSQKVLLSLNEDLDFLGPDLIPSVATAIAEGNIDPSNMEAFNILPSFKCRSYPVVTQTTGRLQKLEMATLSNQASLFPVPSIHKTRDIVVIGDSVPEKSNFLKEDVSFEKLIIPTVTHETKGHAEVDEIQLMIPSNNPFKRVKLEELSMEHNENSNEHISLVFEDEELDMVCITPHENSMPNRKDIKTKQSSIDSSTEVVSVVVTEVQSPDMLNVKMESQESVTSNYRIVSKRKARDNSVKIKGRCKSLSNDKSSILNYFSRVQNL